MLDTEAEAKADKTRVAASTSETVAKATSADRPGSTNDQTRVAIRSNNKEADSIEATRFKSDTPAAVDKTRIAPSRRLLRTAPPRRRGARRSR